MKLPTLTFLLNLLKPTLSVEDKKVLAQLNSSSVKSKKVVGRGRLTCDSAELLNSDKFKGYQEQATKLIELQNS